MVSRLKSLMQLTGLALAVTIFFAWLIGGCAVPVDDQGETYAVHPAPGSQSDAGLPVLIEPPYNCFSTRISPTEAVWICEWPQPFPPYDPGPKEKGDPLR